MSKITRRQLLIFFGSSAATTVLAPQLTEKLFGINSTSAEAALSPLSFTPLRLPHPLPVYKELSSFMPTALNGQGTVMAASQNTRLTSYNVVDDVVVPPEYERYVILRWGDRVFPDSADYFGYNNDYTGFVEIRGSNDDGYLWVNHEYISFPMSKVAPEAPADVASFPATDRAVLGLDLSVKNRATLGEFLYNLGGSIVRITKQADGRFRAIARDSLNRRIHGLSGLGINSQRADKYKDVTSWGTRRGDDKYLTGTGPAATQVFAQVNSDGLGNRIVGTAYNCSGGTTPWGTILSAEENFQGSELFFVGVQENVKPNGGQTGYAKGTTGEEFGLVGEKYGWMVEVDLQDPNFRPRKHTALGRFRHENVAIRAEAGRKLVVYMGDDRRGGHTWKFVSNGTVTNPADKSNSRLFEDGTLYVAQYNRNGAGRWLPLALNSPTNPIRPSKLGEAELASFGKAQRDANTRLPKRAGIAGQTEDGGSFVADITNEATTLAGYRNKSLANFYTSQGAVLVDAFLAANLIGGTPTARPEDLEINPTTKEVFIAYTDAAPGSDGYPDSRIFTVAKYTAALNSTQQSGGIYKIIEDSSDGAGLTFRWQRFAQGGEAGAVAGAGFASVDNLAFDTQGNIWGVTDMSTSTHNGFDVGAAAKQATIDHKKTGNVSEFTGVFGNNWLFYIPTNGPNAGTVIPFAQGPNRCEITGPTFIGDTLVVAVQHPGEDCPIDDGTVLSRQIEMLDLSGAVFNQTRTVARGSLWPSNIENDRRRSPMPSVIGIRRVRSTTSGQFV
ncbi:MAG: PhoX family phosphatase [Microcoleus sp. PH2017_01_SCD_O_A]|uniref:PhoX family protein n=3 Tax=unclassified Microcoleus TaxID=2642155 RepID=UPI001D61750F|nr:MULTISPECIES: PhoX family phosphatase [unclassified Microcoleus]MCC3421328.1 PhoX family phosphatase [Microcoleus sp. PH2017_07_MST_O_A]TAF86476.1 MAG: PhoX family phosphatase [Oscillatoriales cyanobacterium]MCC3428142.1 PhoX family phosphatase [Microcoleus sp. PH2017_01_SCD_O_A]MCC3450549.1 PhoX family phosphatase [Microcoleus sp. PH2017_09_SFU_O_A]MCC3457737.1 PhoX family phosphatase [Microcoleus sp. PH2017_08_TRC_O_A]